MRLRKSPGVLLGCLMSVAGSAAFGSATYDGMSVPGVLSVSVDAEGATLDAAMVTENVTNIVKTGSGRLTATPLASYRGDFTIDEGEFEVAQQYDLGADNVGIVTINDGASLVDGAEINNWGLSLAKGKTIVFSGDAAPDSLAKLYRSNNSGRTWLASASTFRFLSDATVDFRRQRIKLLGTIDLGGHTLMLNDGNAWAQIQVDCMVTNGGTILVQGYTDHYTSSATTLQCEGGAFGFYPSENPCVLTLTNANFDVRHSCKANGATLNLIDADAGTYRNSLKTKTDAYRWDGPVNAFRTCRLAFNTSYTNVFNVAGNIGGSGTLSIGPGWLNLSDSPNSTYSGAVTVKADATGKIATEHSGVAMKDNSPFFPSAQSVTFRDGANLLLCNDYVQPLPKLAFAGAGTATVTGGRTPVNSLPRATLAGITKTDVGTLYLETPVRVTGTTTISGGTLQLAPKVYGHAGLWEWFNADMSKGNASGQNSWCNYYWDFQNGYMPTNQADAVYSRGGPSKVFSGFNSIVSNGFTRATGAIYQGYLWNRSEEPVTWQLAMHQTYRGEIQLNGIWTPFGGSSERGTNVFTTTLQPGPNPILIYSLSASWYATQAPSARFDGLGLSYDPNPVEGETNVAHFVKLDDGGTGRLFTIDTEDSPEAAADLLPVFDNLAFAPGATFDLNGNTFLQGDLTGSPTVLNGDLMITNSWTLSTADIAAGQKLAVDGTLSFGVGVKITSVDTVALSGKTVKEYEIATATAVTGTPVVDATSALKGWRVQTTATSVKIVYVPNGTAVLFR